MNIVGDVRTIQALLLEAERQAHALGDDEPGAEHLVLSALMLESDDSARTLLGVGPDEFRAALLEVHAAALNSVGVAPSEVPGLPTREAQGIYRSDASAQEVFQRARVLAKSARPRGLTAAQIVRAAAEREYGTVSRVLAQLQIDRESLL